MVSSQFEREIMRGNAENKTINISESLFNYNVGRGAGVIIESITIQPFKLAVIEFDPSLLQNTIERIQELFDRNCLFTLNVYGNGKERNFTFKQKLTFTIIDNAANTSTLICTSATQLTKDVFWNFESENLTFEFTDVRNTISNAVASILAPYKLDSKRNTNPNGFILPNATFTQYSGGIFDWNIRNMGKQVRTILPGTTMDGFIIPRNGNGTTGNIIQRPSGSLANGSQMIVNVGIIEYNNVCKHNLI